jgi:SAM-dependent methyltransferase
VLKKQRKTLERNAMSDLEALWSEESSETYRHLSAIAVPGRTEQMAALLTLAPLAIPESSRVVELGCGEGLLAQAFLQTFPRVEVLALDGSASMRAAAAKRLSPYGSRVEVQAFDLFADDWLRHAQDANLVVSSLCLHHLNAAGKQRLFFQLARLLPPRAALLLADLVEPQCDFARTLFADTWDRSAERQALAHTETPGLFEKFLGTQWNYFRFPDEVDHPSGLFEQLQWLKNAGFTVVDCFWMQAGHAIYGGYKEAALPHAGGISFPEAWRAAETVGQSA